jgi:hypothetical protein
MLTDGAAEAPMIYSTFLFLHSCLRWLVLIFGLTALFLAWRGRSAGSPYEAIQKKLSTWFVASVHTNFLIGIVLFVSLSPVTQTAFEDFGAAMKTSLLRFFAVEHPTGMLIAVILATVGSARIKRAASDAESHGRVLLFFGLALAIIVMSIPWPFYSAGRPLLSFPF